MDNRHNPIARIIEELQKRWIDNTGKVEDYRLVCWLVDPREQALINGFYKLESSPHGSVPEFFVVMVTPFADRTTYSQQLVADMISMWEQDPAVKQTGTEWDARSFSNRIERGENPNDVLVSMLTDFYENICNKERALVFGLVPQTISDISDYNDWFVELSGKLPDVIKLSVVDHIGENHFKAVCKHLKDKAVVIRCGDLGLDEAVNQIARGGGANANDPEIGFRQCLFGMADGVKAKDVKRIDRWGEKALEIAQRTGIKSFYATAYLVYAGFLLQRRNDRAVELLDKGIAIAEKAYHGNDMQCVSVLNQLYGFKSAYYGIKGQHSPSAFWLLTQARFAVENKLGAYAITICRMSANMAKNGWDEQAYVESLTLGYHAGDELTDEELRVSEISTLAYYYVEELGKNGSMEEVDQIHDRMRRLFGDEWQDHILPLSTKHGQAIPDIEQAIQSMNS